jgi:hypothetical protein
MAGIRFPEANFCGSKGKRKESQAKRAQIGAKDDRITGTDRVTKS